MAVAVCKQEQHGQQEWPIFYAATIKIPLSIMWKEEERHSFPAGCVSAP